jgi:hypothetical protein
MIAPVIASTNGPCEKKTCLLGNMDAGYASVYLHIIGAQAPLIGVISI